MAFFSELRTIRLRKEELDALDELSEKYPFKYETVSQTIRCAIIELLRSERGVEENAHKRIKSR
jgi:hypothetical protein